MKEIILASSSPRRSELLRQLGLQFTVDSTDHDENVSPAAEPRQLVRELSLKKARAVAARHRNAIVIAADTMGVLEGQVLGKPENDNQAVEMLKAMSGKCHTVITGFSIIDTDTNKTTSRTVETRVYFRQLDPSEINAYVRSGESRDKAGAYAIQGLGSVLVEKIDGDYTNVVGLPLSALALALKEFGINIL